MFIVKQTNLTKTAMTASCSVHLFLYNSCPAISHRLNDSMLSLVEYQNWGSSTGYSVSLCYWPFIHVSQSVTNKINLHHSVQHDISNITVDYSTMVHLSMDHDQIPRPKQDRNNLICSPNYATPWLHLWHTVIYKITFATGHFQRIRVSQWMSFVINGIYLYVSNTHYSTGSDYNKPIYLSMRWFLPLLIIGFRYSACSRHRQNDVTSIAQCLHLKTLYILWCHKKKHVSLFLDWAILINAQVNVVTV